MGWNWGSSTVTGEVAEKKENGKMTKESKGKPITKNASKDNPAYFVQRKVCAAESLVAPESSSLTAYA